MSDCGGQDIVGELYVQPPFGGTSLHFRGDFRVCELKDLELELLRQTFAFLTSFFNYLFLLLPSFVNSN